MTPHAEEFRVHVGTDYLRWEGLTVYIAARYRGELHLAQPVNLAMSEPLGEAVAYPDEPTLRIPDTLGRALLEALSQHYGGVADVRQARQDLDLERGRVDRLIDVVSGIAAATKASVPGRP